MRTHIATIAAAAVLALSAPIALTAVAAPTTSPEPGTPPASAPVTPAPEVAETPQVGGWPKATYNGRTVTISNLAPGWDVTLSAINTRTKKEYVYRAKSKGTTVVIEMKGLPAGTYDIGIQAGDLPANEALYWGYRVSDPAPSGTKTPTKDPKKDQRGGLARTGV